jgi:hypothetical protein
MMCKCVIVSMPVSDVTRLEGSPREIVISAGQWFGVILARISIKPLIVGKSNKGRASNLSTLVNHFGPKI